MPAPHRARHADVRDLGALLTTAGFTLTTVDVDHVVIRYPNAFALLDDLRAMGESNAIMRRCGARPFAANRPATLTRHASRPQAGHAQPGRAAGRSGHLPRYGLQSRLRYEGDARALWR